MPKFTSLTVEFFDFHTMISIVLRVLHEKQHAGTPTEVFSCEFRELFKNTFFTEPLRTTASECNSSIQRFLQFSRFKQEEALFQR